MNQLFSADAKIPLFLLYDALTKSYGHFKVNFWRSVSDPKVKQHRAQSILGWVTAD